MNDEHRGVGVIVRNRAGSRFYVQQKDAEYPRYPLGYSLFGGEREAGETPIEALVRELDEELGQAATIVRAGRLTEIAEHQLGSAGSGFRFWLFESVVDDDQLDALGRAPVFEGERGAVVTRAELRALPFVWDLGGVITDYLDHLESPD